MSVRTLTDFLSDFCHHSLARVLTNFDLCFRYDSRFPNPVPRASSLSIALRSLDRVKREMRRVDFGISIKFH
jgi:hypothetical protein